ncbi:MAG: GGDEF domain-containing protein [Candidatus Dormibacteraeota bacterium]|uniref:GGDEF domain-containing protein n=1 Tax=Candidatus Aeolococcus gillhamiae TaxID=3127015 RepID=A0A934JYV9_9BACT|nr:GGDEF domain-containing protein [Candidatus Dormibacteraeota bacterium]
MGHAGWSELHRRNRESARPVGAGTAAARNVLAYGRQHHRLISPALDVLCVAFIGLLYLTEQTTLWLHCVYIVLSLGAFIRRGARPTLSRSSAYTAIMLVYMVHISATDDFLEIPMMWVISILAAGLAQVNENSAREHERLAATDHLTGLANRRRFEEHLVEIGPAAFAVLAVDIDGLKAINDSFGHEAGDALLAAAARGIQSAVRREDVAARTGGDEFAVILLDADAAVAAEIAERICRAVRAERVPFGKASVSVGWATGEPAAYVAEVVDRADRALYQAKSSGRDRVAGPAAVVVAA